ncbi:hypothetical protein PRtIB026_A19630 [Pseudomonas sp. RtIB026]|nr:hypothetical protein PRtIB026_A19630 [Pseudomonas sp. RtIB026]
MYCGGDPINYADRNGRDRTGWKHRITVQRDIINSQGNLHPTESLKVAYSPERSRQAAVTAQKDMARNVYVGYEIGSATYNVASARRMYNSGRATPLEVGSNVVAASLNIINAGVEVGKMPDSNLYNFTGVGPVVEYEDIPYVVVDFGLKLLSVGVDMFAANMRVRFNRRGQNEAGALPESMPLQET